MKIVPLTETIGVSEQITPEDVSAVAAAGYKVLVNNRPDGEVENQPTSAEIEKAAREAGLEYHYLPVVAPDFQSNDFSEMRAVFNNPERPVMAYCRTGTRCTNLWVATREESDRDAARTHARGLGYDLAMSTPK